MADRNKQGATMNQAAQTRKPPSQRKRDRILNKSRSALVQNISGALVIKDEDLFFLCESDGRVPLKGPHGFGLYYHDCRFLNGYEMHLAGIQPNTLVATAREGFKADLELTNPDLRMPHGSLLQKEDLGIKWVRLVQSSQNALQDRVAFRNYRTEPLEADVAFGFRAEFEDVFQVRGMAVKKRGNLHAPAWRDGELVFEYDGSDNVQRSVTVHFTPQPEHTRKTTAHFRVRLQPQEEQTIQITVGVAESSASDPTARRAATPSDTRQVASSLHRETDQWVQQQTAIRSTKALLDRTLERSLRDLRVLRSTLHDQRYFAAGVPWYVTLFGRDSLTAALQTLAFEPRVAESTLRLLAQFQGTKVDEWRDEQPGKIMHELRVGEMARTNQIPQTPYYGTIDATPLFLVLIARHALWTGSLALFEDLRESVEKALDWMASYGDPTGSGYLAYECKSNRGLGNQGWKDSGDAIMNADGSLAEPPIALAEVQGYVYMAKTGLADLYRRAGDGPRAQTLEREAEELRERFNRDFWLEDKGVYALALQKGNRPAAVVASNAGQVLWSGIAQPEKARRTMERLMAEDMFSGWGIRTLSAQERRYNPIGYHLGTVWPHDNSLIVAGLRTYGFDDAALKVFSGILDAATHFHTYRLPEVFAGFPRDEFGVPVHYPVACHPQAWAAGSVPYMTTALLGLLPDGFEQRLHVVRPVLPASLAELEVHQLRVGKARIDLRFHRDAKDQLRGQVLRVDGALDVVISPD